MIKKMLIAAGIFTVVFIVGGILALIIGGENESAEVKLGDAVFKVEI